MKISKIKIRPVIPHKGHIAFVSFVIDDWLFVDNIAIFKRLNKENIRLVFPVKKVGNNNISLFYPLSSTAYYEIETIIQDDFKRHIQQTSR